MKISVVIPNYNGAKLLEKNLPKIINKVGDAEIIIVDDASSDKSVQEIRKLIINNKRHDIKLIQNIKNLGFSSTVNRGVIEAKGDLIVLLNTDVIPEKDFLIPVLPLFKDEKIFAAGFLQKCPEGGKIVLRGRGVGKFEKGFLMHKRGEVDKNDTLWVSAGAGIFSKRIWQKLGGLCELFNPYYWEDIDLSYRAQKSGFKIRFEPKSVVTHEQLMGAIRSNYSTKKIKTIAYKNQFLFVWLNISDRNYIVQHIFFVPLYFLKSFLRFDTAFMKGFFLALLKLIQIIKYRKRYLQFWKKKDFDII